jgi:hypothetical protein
MDLVDRILKRAKRKGAPEGFSGTVWYEISSITAGKLVRESYGDRRRAPRPGYEIDLPPTTRHGHPGHWLLSNRAGRYELQFMYGASY